MRERLPLIGPDLACVYPWQGDYTNPDALRKSYILPRFGLCLSPGGGIVHTLGKGRSLIWVLFSILCNHHCYDIIIWYPLMLVVLLSIDFLLHKEKQIPTQLRDKWRKAALAVSYASVFCAFVIGVSSFGKHTCLHRRLSNSRLPYFNF